MGEAKQKQLAPDAQPLELCLLRLVVNWLGIALAPVWIIPAMLIGVALDIGNSDTFAARIWRRGEAWFWE